MDWTSDKRRDALAADYVLGLLQGQARTRFERRLNEDQDLERRVIAMRVQLDPLLHAPPVEPSAELWKNIETKLNWRSDESPRMRWFLAAAALTASIVIGLFVTNYISLPGKQPTIMAVLHDTHKQQVASVELADNGRVVTIRVLKSLAVPDNHSLELWALPHSGNPVAIGLLPTKAGSARQFKLAVEPSKLGGFAVSVEPPGGAPGALPTGPIIYQGKIASIKQASKTSDS